MHVKLKKILKCCARTPAQSLFVVSYFADSWEGLTLQVAVSTYIILPVSIPRETGEEWLELPRPSGKRWYGNFS